jgi:NAD(P)-dependent dehydrogenase (short-subunit alcohol dehydrogenase family)
MNPHPGLRTNVVSGARSGIGRATTELLRGRGERVLGVDLHDSDIVADLATTAGRRDAIEAVERASPQGIDSLILCAGLAGGHPGEAVVSVNYFGAVELALGLRAWLARGTAARVVVVCSSAAILPFDAAVVDACLRGDEAGARRAATCSSDEELARRSGPIYAASKLALTRWIRRTSPLADWAGTGILLNGVAPGLVRTPMTIPMLETARGRAILAQAVPRAVRDAAEPGDVAELLVFLASDANRCMVGQVPFCDGGTDVIMRGDAVI